MVPLCYQLQSEPSAVADRVSISILNARGDCLALCVRLSGKWSFGFFIIILPCPLLVLFLFHKTL